MKQMTESQLRELLSKAFHKGNDLALDQERGAPLLDHVEWDKVHDDFIQKLIDSI